MNIPALDRTRNRQLIAVLVLGACLLAIVVALGWRFGPAAPGARPGTGSDADPRAVQAPPPNAPPPAITPTTLIAVSPTDARAINAAVPFVPGKPAAARPFRLDGSADDREAATVCLAAATWYEAGDDAVGQRAVAQVVLNRVRHPAFPNSVCGVVLQGSELPTGCQFTFTCDGALARRPSEAAWKRARAIAAAALSGTVDPTVGNATHYHTDWVVPYWSSSLDKIAKVGTHLFFRWRGWWGRPTAFRNRYAGGERPDPRLPGADALPQPMLGIEPPSIVPTVEAGLTRAPTREVALPGLSAAELKGTVVRTADLATNSFALHVRKGSFPGSWALAAVAVCRGRPDCTVVGYLDPRRIPERLPIPPEQAALASFLYRRGADASSGRALWHCGQVAEAPEGRCFPGTES